MTVPFEHDLRRILPPHLRDIPRWEQFFEAMSEVFYAIVDKQRVAMSRARTPESLSRAYKALMLHSLGLDYDTGKMTDEEMERVANFLSLYYDTQEHSFARFMGFMRSTRFNVNPLWSHSAEGEVGYGQLTFGPNLPVWQGGADFPTSHVGLGYDADWTGFDEADVRALFHKLAPIHLVLAFLARTHYANLGTIYVATGATQWGMHSARMAMPNAGAELYFGHAATQWGMRSALVEENLDVSQQLYMGETALLSGESTAYFCRSIEAGVPHYGDLSEFHFARGTEAAYVDAAGYLNWSAVARLRTDHHVAGGSGARAILEPYRINRMPSPMDPGGVNWVATSDADLSVNSTGNWDRSPINILSCTTVVIEQVLDQAGNPVLDQAGNPIFIQVVPNTDQHFDRFYYLPAGDHVLSFVTNTALSTLTNCGFVLSANVAVNPATVNVRMAIGANPVVGTVSNGATAGTPGYTNYASGFQRHWVNVNLPVSGIYRLRLYPGWGVGPTPDFSTLGIWALGHIQVEAGPGLPTTPIRSTLANPFGVRDADELWLDANTLGNQLTILMRYEHYKRGSADDTLPVHARSDNSDELLKLAVGATVSTLTARAYGYTNIRTWTTDATDKWLVTFGASEYTVWHGGNQVGATDFAFNRAPQWSRLDLGHRPTAASQATIMIDEFYVLSGPTAALAADALTT